MNEHHPKRLLPILVAALAIMVILLIGLVFLLVLIFSSSKDSINSLQKRVDTLNVKVQELKLPEPVPGKDGLSIKGEKGDSIKGDKGDSIKGDPGETKIIYQIINNPVPGPIGLTGPIGLQGLQGKPARQKEFCTNTLGVSAWRFVGDDEWQVIPKCEGLDQ